MKPSPCFVCGAPAEVGSPGAEFALMLPSFKVCRCSDPKCSLRVLRLVFNPEHWERLCMEAEVVHFAAAVAGGEPLDKLAEMYGIERCPGESDDSLRLRIESARGSLP